MKGRWSDFKTSSFGEAKWQEEVLWFARASRRREWSAFGSQPFALIVGGKAIPTFFSSGITEDGLQACNSLKLNLLN